MQSPQAKGARRERIPARRAADLLHIPVADLLEQAREVLRYDAGGPMLPKQWVFREMQRRARADLAGGSPEEGTDPPAHLPPGVLPTVKAGRNYHENPWYRALAEREINGLASRLIRERRYEIAVRAFRPVVSRFRPDLPWELSYQFTIWCIEAGLSPQSGEKLPARLTWGEKVARLPRFGQYCRKAGAITDGARRALYADLRRRARQRWYEVAIATAGDPTETHLWSLVEVVEAPKIKYRIQRGETLWTTGKEVVETGEIADQTDYAQLRLAIVRQLIADRDPNR